MPAKAGATITGMSMPVTTLQVTIMPPKATTMPATTTATDPAAMSTR